MNSALEVLAFAAVAAKASENAERHRLSASDSMERLKGALGEIEALRRDLRLALQWGKLMETMVPVVHRDPLREWFLAMVSGDAHPRIRVKAGSVRA